MIAYKLVKKIDEVLVKETPESLTKNGSLNNEINMKKIAQYNNGNVTVSLEEDGSRIIEFEGTPQLDYPLNVDIRVSNKCSFGLNPKTGKSTCTFCHESATTDGYECDYDKLKNKISQLPPFIELAVGGNEITDGLMQFLAWCKRNNYFTNLTVNQGHLKRDLSKILLLMEEDLIKGLGVSYRPNIAWDVPQEILDYENTVFHAIIGIDDITDILTLHERGVRKILLLGEKDFGFNKGKVDTTSRKHKEWLWWVCKLFKTFDVTSFDNLALEQLRVQRFFTQENWDVFNQREFSLYLDAVNGYYCESSRSNNNRVSWDNMTIRDYFKNIRMK